MGPAFRLHGSLLVDARRFASPFGEFDEVGVRSTIILLVNVSV
jgi:hypothetical protein